MRGYRPYEASEDFEKFWTAYPKKRAKGDARKAWVQTEGIRPELNRILDAITVMCASDDWQKDGGQFVPHPATWLRGEGWEDAPEVTLVNGKVWWQTVAGIESKAKELGIEWNSRIESFQAFAKRIRNIAEQNVVVPMRGA